MRNVLIWNYHYTRYCISRLVTFFSPRPNMTNISSRNRSGVHWTLASDKTVTREPFDPNLCSFPHRYFKRTRNETKTNSVLEFAFTLFEAAPRWSTFCCLRRRHFLRRQFLLPVRRLSDPQLASLSFGWHCRCLLFLLLLLFVVCMWCGFLSGTLYVIKIYTPFRIYGF